MGEIVRKSIEVATLILMYLIGIGVIGILTGVTLTPFALIVGYVDSLNNLLMVSSALISIPGLLLLLIVLNSDE